VQWKGWRTANVPKASGKAEYVPLSPEEEAALSDLQKVVPDGPSERSKGKKARPLNFGQLRSVLNTHGLKV
jgi:hypothetical protein